VDSIFDLRYVPEPWKLTTCQPCAAADAAIDMRILCVSLCVPAALLFPVAAAAKIVPPGNSGADQYAETLPGPEGNQPTDSGGAGRTGGNQPTHSGGAGGGRLPGVLSPARQRGLAELGPAGRATADLAQSTASRRQQIGPTTGEDPTGVSGFVDVLKQGGGSGVSGGIGIVLPLIMAGSLLAAIVRLGRRS
jgi:hypothetical protein